MERSDWSLDVNESKNDNDNNWSTFNLASDNQLEREKNNKVDNTSRSTFFNNNVRSFGDYVEKHDWVECKSKSIPGKTYYFNLRSGCSTWYRPISRYIDIPYYPERFVENKHSNDDRVNELSENNINKKYGKIVKREPKRRLVSPLKKKYQISKRHVVEKDKEDTKPERIICNMYGVTTVNYDEVSELPPNVKRSNLSDSTSIVSSSTTEENRSRSSILECFLGHDDLYDNILPPKLSDSNSSTSSSSRTCDTCSSCSCTQSDSTQG
uniref:WW domain-containing protein n=1 Tax=Vespula pensylvanica TaxID=30213 RepID=A0A834P6G3_VESPE|nr:hypothetical protein H0235_006256 [Vespula pensylvanica]